MPSDAADRSRVPCSGDQPGSPSRSPPSSPSRSAFGSSPPEHRVIAADRHVVPAPFRAFAVRSDEPVHAWQARAPYGQVHLVKTSFLDADARARLAAAGDAQVRIEVFADVDYARTTLAELAAAAPGVHDLAGHIARALLPTGVLGPNLAAYERSVGTRIDYLAARGAGFHNDVSRHWSRSLFWLLALDLAAVDFVMPHAGVCLALAPGDLLVFDQTMAHGLSRSGDGGQVLAASFGAGARHRQLFLTGELLLDDAQWARLGAPWRPVEDHAQLGALDLMVAEFDDRSGAIQRVRALRDSMKRSTCHVDGWESWDGCHVHDAHDGREGRDSVEACDGRDQAAGADAPGGPTGSGAPGQPTR